jgi:hypothetical protein
MDEARLLAQLDKAIKKFSGNAAELESAVGLYLVARRFGWRVVYLWHSPATIRKYERIIGVALREVCEAEGELARRSAAWGAVKKLGGFWKVVKGEKSGVRSTEILPK